MTDRDFVYWLQGYLEVDNPETINKEKTQIIKDHLNLVFKKETPDRRGFLKSTAALAMGTTAFGGFNNPPPIVYGDPTMFFPGDIQGSC